MYLLFIDLLIIFRGYLRSIESVIISILKDHFYLPFSNRKSTKKSPSMAIMLILEDGIIHGKRPIRLSEVG